MNFLGLLIAIAAVILSIFNMANAPEEVKPNAIKSQQVTITEKRWPEDTMPASIGVVTWFGNGQADAKTYYPIIDRYGNPAFSQVSDRNTYAKVLPTVATTEHVSFHYHGKGFLGTVDTHKAYDPATDTYTIPVTGIYFLNDVKNNGAYIEFTLTAGNRLQGLRKLESKF